VLTEKYKSICLANSELADLPSGTRVKKDVIMSALRNKEGIFVNVIIKGSILAFDSDWQYPAITEQHAYSQCLKLLPSIPNILYLAFPWATLIDQLMRKVSADRLVAALEYVQGQTKDAKAVITVCQHIHMLKFQHLFAQAGITHIFWTHAVQGQNFLPAYKNIHILPFPLFPVQTPDFAKKPNKKKLLYSFVGAKANQWYLTESRNNIIDNLSSDGRGLVVGRDQWHFNKIVYDHQIHSKVDVNHELINQDASAQYKRVLEDSIFSLCPSGTGPNSIRLWESICYGSIPVVLADTYLPPGNKALWEEATISCQETLEDILALPDYLEALARDEALLARKQHALRQLLLMYGPDCFVYDIQKLFLSLINEIEYSMAAPLYSTLLHLASEIDRGVAASGQILDIFILGCSSRALVEPSTFMAHYSQNKEFRNAYKKAIAACGSKYAGAMLRALTYRQLTLV
jgi:hypothetical protein